jgi:hypothetical protein
LGSPLGANLLKWRFVYTSVARADGPLVTLLVAALALSGCTAVDSGAKDASPGPSFAAPPETTKETGSIRGIILDDEQLPIVRASVSLLDPIQETKTDDLGLYTFNGLPPRNYSVVVTKIGYSQDSRKVSVRAGEVTQANFALKAIVVREPWIEKQTRTQNVITGNYVSVAPNDVQTWRYRFALNDNPKSLQGMLFEPTWTPSTILGDGMRFWSGIGNYNSGKDLCSKMGNRPFDCPVPAEKYQQDWGCDYDFDPKSCYAEWMFRPGGSSVALGHVGAWPSESITVYTSMAYQMPFPEGYTARPPPS